MSVDDRVLELGAGTPLWWAQRQIDTLPPLDVAAIRAQADAHRERERRFVALFRVPGRG